MVLRCENEGAIGLFMKSLKNPDHKNVENKTFSLEKWRRNFNNIKIIILFTSSLKCSLFP
jgi:hypothetical protein